MGKYVETIHARHVWQTKSARQTNSALLTNANKPIAEPTKIAKTAKSALKIYVRHAPKTLNATRVRSAKLENVRLVAGATATACPVRSATQPPKPAKDV